MSVLNNYRKGSHRSVGKTRVEKTYQFANGVQVVARSPGEARAISRHTTGRIGDARDRKGLRINSILTGVVAGTTPGLIGSGGDVEDILDNIGVMVSPGTTVTIGANGTAAVSLTFAVVPVAAGKVNTSFDILGAPVAAVPDVAFALGATLASIATAVAAAINGKAAGAVTLVATALGAVVSVTASNGAVVNATASIEGTTPA